MDKNFELVRHLNCNLGSKLHIKNSYYIVIYVPDTKPSLCAIDIMEEGLY